MSAAEKRRVAVDRIREPDIACPYCGTRTLVHDLVAHVEERCPGMHPVHKRSSWATRREVLELGLPKTTLDRYAQRGRIRTRLQSGAKLYLLRDVVTVVVLRRKTRSPKNGPQVRRASKALTDAPRSVHKRTMTHTLDNDLRKRLQRFAETVGGFAPASRKLDMSPDTLRRAATGGNIRQGTATLIKMQLTRCEKRT